MYGGKLQHPPQRMTTKCLFGGLAGEEEAQETLVLSFKR